MPRELPPLDVLLPADRTGVPLAPEPGEPVLHDLYAHPAPRPGRTSAVRANMIATLDGAAQGPDGRSRSINGPADWRVFRVMRAVADVVLVGAGTARAEQYTPLAVPADLREARAARGQAPDLALALVTASGDLPEGLRGTDRPPYVVTVAANPRLDALRADLGADRVLVTGETTVDLGAALDALAALGRTRVLAEGGPRLLTDLVRADLVDELCLTTSPLVVGGPGLRALGGTDWLDPRRARAAHLLHHDGMLLGRWTLDPA
ncbi:dihydrofolate reductase family protein [Cellulomonas triticagri]|uniref:Deaminase n=1 Tax=Cellulomonas triticagri TaxID=2483352 RepID=A0A3M2JR71_9CELL|nr:dihydrofolate reductase family protein [Cellulomonas triticagri]RMI13175.1 deaminase [Cellulomonas triticagri]